MSELPKNILRLFDTERVLAYRSAAPQHLTLAFSGSQVYEERHQNTCYLVKVDPTTRIRGELLANEQMGEYGYDFHLDIHSKLIYILPRDDEYPDNLISIAALPIQEFTDDDIEAIVEFTDNYDIDLEPVYSGLDLEEGPEDDGPEAA